MSKKNLNCAKCQKILNYLPCHSYAEPPTLKSKDGQFYCFDCFKSVSHCKVCDKSVANMKIDIDDKKTWYQPWEKIYWRDCENSHPFDMCGTYCDFLCSPECFAKDDNRNHQLWKKNQSEKLEKGWKHCEECVELFNWIKEGSRGMVGDDWLLGFGYIVPPEEKICKMHKRSKEADLYVKQVIYPKAQKWWDSLTYAEKLAEVKRLDIHWIIRKGEKEGRKATHQEVAQEKEVPPFIISQKFEHKEPCISCGKTWKVACEINCGKNSPDGKTSYCASCPSSTENNENGPKNETKNSSSGLVGEIDNKRNQLQKLKENGSENSEEVRQLEWEIQDLLKNQKNIPANESSTENKHNVITYSIIGFLVVFLIGIVILLVKPKRKNHKIK